jgi:DnaJ-domain-containing protein 1
MGMQLFFRLIRIIQARFHRDQDGDPLNSHGHWEEREDAAGNGTDSGSQSEGTRKSFDTGRAGYYANLEVPYGSDLGTVRWAWKRLARKYHPDIHSGDPDKRRVANELMQGLNRAYENLVKYLKK